MKKILFFTHYLVGGGAEKTVVNLASYINRHEEGHEAHIAVVYDDATLHGQLEHIHVLSHKTDQHMSKFRKIPVIIHQVQDLKRLKKEIKPDVCISFLPGADFLNVLSKNGEKLIVSVRNKESFFYHTLLKKMYIKFCYRRADHIVAISKRVKEDIVSRFGIRTEKVTVIYNPVPDITERTDTVGNVPDMPKDGKVIINAGRLTRQKGQGYLIRAFYLLSQRITNVNLIILGQGELETEYKKLTAALGIAERVSFPGFVRNPGSYIQKADLFLFSSIVEGLGNILLETMQCEIPIISTDCDAGPREILAPQTPFDASTSAIEFAQYGVLIPVCAGDWKDISQFSREEEIMAEAMEKMLADEDMQNSYRMKSRERAKDFEVSKIVLEWLNIT